MQLVIRMVYMLYSLVVYFLLIDYLGALGRIGCVATADPIRAVEREF